MATNKHRIIKYNGRWEAMTVIPNVRPDDRTPAAAALKFIHGQVTRTNGRQPGYAKPYMGD